jgi:hypothetical protein
VAQTLPQRVGICGSPVTKGPFRLACLPVSNPLFSCMIIIREHVFAVKQNLGQRRVFIVAYRVTITFCHQWLCVSVPRTRKMRLPLCGYQRSTRSHLGLILSLPGRTSTAPQIWSIVWLGRRLDVFCFC